MATAVQAGKVKVVVTKVPRWFLLGREGTMTINRADFVGLAVSDVVKQVEAMRFWKIKKRCILNGRELTKDEANTTLLQPGDRLELEDP